MGGLSTKFHELAHSSLYAQRNDGNSQTFCDLGYGSYLKKKEKKKRNKLSCDEESISCVKNSAPKRHTFKTDIAFKVNILKLVVCQKGAQWLSGRVLDSRPRDCGIKPHLRHCVVSLSKNINPSLVLVQPRKTRPFITERLLMGCKESNLTKLSSRKAQSNSADPDQTASEEAV